MPDIFKAIEENSIKNDSIVVGVNKQGTISVLSGDETIDIDDIATKYTNRGGIHTQYYSRRFNWNDDFDTIPNIATDYTAWKTWAEKRVGQFEKKCPKNRTTTLYFSQSGNDSTGDGSIGNPYLTVAHADSLMASDTRFRFKRGEEWNEAGGIDVNVDNVTVDDYGDRNLDIPLFNAFANKYSGVDDVWSNWAGNLWTVAETEDVAWLREADDKLGETRGTTLIRVANSAESATTNNSFYWTASTLHVNLGSDDPNDFDLESVTSNSVDGILINSNIENCHIENIRCDGFGCSRGSPVNQRQAFSSRSRFVNLFKSCEGYYASSHVMAHYIGGSFPVGDPGGSTMFLDCTAGFAKYAGGETIFNSFALSGNQEAWFVDCNVKYGTLKSDDWFTNGNVKTQASAFFCHTDGSPLSPTALQVVWKSKAEASHSPVGRLFWTNHLPSISAISDIDSCINAIPESRGWCVDCTQEDIGETHSFAGRGSLPTQCVIYGTKIFATPTNNANLSAQTPTVIDTWFINSLYHFDLSALTTAQTFSIYNASSNNSFYPLFSMFKVLNRNGSNFRWGIDFDSRGSSALASSGTSQDSFVFGNIFGWEDNGTEYYVGLTNTADRLVGNAYFNCDLEAGQDRGFDNDTTAQVLTVEPFLGVSDDQLLLNGPTAFNISHDINGKERVGLPDIGPVQFSN